MSTIFNFKRFVIFSLVSLLFPHPSFATISLSISNPQKVDDYYSFDALVSGIATSSSCFVQAMFTAPDSPHYFGFTWGSQGTWIPYSSAPEKEFITANFVKLQNDQPAKILIKPDFSDPDYKGPGDYLLKLKRYTGASTSSAGESNALTLTLNQTTPTPSPTSTPPVTVTPTHTPTPTSSPSPTPSHTRSPTISPSSTSLSPKPKSSPTPSPETTIRLSEEVLSVSTSAEPISTVSPISPPSIQKPHLLLPVGISFVLIGSLGLLFRYRHLLRKL